MLDVAIISQAVQDAVRATWTVSNLMIQLVYSGQGTRRCGGSPGASQRSPSSLTCMSFSKNII